MISIRPTTLAGPLAALTWGAVAVLWLLDAAGHGLPAAVDRLAVAVAGAVLAAYLGLTCRRLWVGGDRLLLALVAVAFAFHFIGLEHEAASRYFGDEGIYRQHAQAINGGRLFDPWFVYPHLLFYLDAVALWLASLFAPLVAALAKAVYGVEGELAVAALVTRAVTAACGALTVVPVFALARRIAGGTAAGLAGAFAALSPLYLEVAHLNISDVPSAFFATLTLMQVGRLLDRESASDYLLAGLWAGFAAGSKYPAGVVAVAIVALWLRWRLRERRFGWGLLWGGLAAVAAFLASTPSLLVYAGEVYGGGGTDVLFGFRQYARAGWTGVVKDSNVAFYLDKLRWNFGEPLLILGVAGLAAQSRRAWSRLAWMLPFPALYLALLVSMNMAVKRNILPALPMVAVVLGVGVAGWLRWLGRRRPGLVRPALATLLTVCLVLPAARSSALVIKMSRPTTRDLAVEWMRENLPQGSFLVQEVYTPRVGPAYHFPARKPRFVTRLDREELRDPQYDFVFVADAAYNRFIRPRNKRHQAEFLKLTAERYREIFDTFELVREFNPGRFRSGPLLRLYKIDPEAPSYATERTFAAGEALLREVQMRLDGEDALVYAHPHQWGLFKAYLAAGRYRLELDAEVEADGGKVRVMNRDNQEIDSRELAGTGAEVELPRPDKYFFYVHLPAGRLRGVEVAKVTAEPLPGSDRGGPAG